MIVKSMVIAVWVKNIDWNTRNFLNTLTSESVIIFYTHSRNVTHQWLLDKLRRTSGYDISLQCFCFSLNLFVFPHKLFSVLPQIFFSPVVEHPKYWWEGHQFNSYREYPEFLFFQDIDQVTMSFTFLRYMYI